MIACVCLFSVCSVCLADIDKPIEVENLPSSARTMVQKYFSKEKVTLVKEEWGFFEKSYDIIFTSGTKIEFDRNGNWTEISCKGTSVPQSLVPAAITKYVGHRNPSVNIIGIERDRHGYDIKLSNRTELEFDKKFRLTDIDD